MSNALTAYLRDIAKIPRITTDEEQRLGRRIREQHDEAAVQALVEANLRFVVSYAKRYRGHGVSFLDLIHEGNLGLIEAARRFDPSRNVKFISYAVWWVRESLQHLLADQTRAFSFPPKLFSVMNGSGRAVDLSLNEPAGASRELGDLIEQRGVTAADDDLVHRAELDELTAAIGDLDGRERAVVRLRFGIDDDHPRTLRDVGDRMRLSHERVRQIETAAKEKLRRAVTLRARLN